MSAPFHHIRTCRRRGRATTRLTGAAAAVAALALALPACDGADGDGMLAPETSMTAEAALDARDAPALAATNGQAAAVAASSNTTRGQIYLNVDVPSACFGGATVHLEGWVDYRIHAVTDGREVQHGQAYYNWQDVAATMGPYTWHTTARLELYTIMNYEFTNPFLPIPQTEKDGDPAVFHHVGAIRFKSDGNAPDLYVRHIVQLVSDANGVLRVDRHMAELLDCR